jgi:hypothetical protein
MVPARTGVGADAGARPFEDEGCGSRVLRDADL